MSFNDRQNLTEDCPLTKDKSRECKLSNCCGAGGFKLIICCFATLTFAITAALILQLSYTNLRLQQQNGESHGAVATDYANCSQIGTKILRKGGNAVDAAVAATICMMVVSPHKTGLGGGGYLMIYNHKMQKSPLIVDFASGTIEGAFSKTLSIRLPAALKGLEFAQSLKGNLQWSEVLEPSIDLARDGFLVSKELAYELSKNPDYSSLYGHLSAGFALKLPKLADTLEQVAKFGSNVFYNGSLSQNILNVTEMKDDVSKDLASYQVSVHVAKKSSFYKYAIFYPRQSSSALQATIEELNNLNISLGNSSTLESQILVAKSLIRCNVIHSGIDANVQKERFSGVVAMDSQDTYVSVITGLNTPLGLGRMSPAGFLLDSVGNHNNFSNFAPIIFYDEEDKCGLRGVFASDDPSLTGQLLYGIILRRLNASAAVEEPRYYFLADEIAIENDSKHSVDDLLRVQLNLIMPPSHDDVNLLSKSVNLILKEKNSITSHSDSRGGGLASRF